MDSRACKKSSTSQVKCTLCSKKFECNKLLNRHKKRVHKIVPATVLKRECRILCPLCEEKTGFESQQILRKHLEEKHALSIELLTLEFSSMREYDVWKQNEKIETGYTVHRTSRGNDYKEVNYICNRSDSKGNVSLKRYQPKYVKRAEKSGGTIKIKGMCPSQLICKFYHNGTISVRFWKTHAGHEHELRSLHLSTSEKNIIVEKLKSGLSANRIIEDAWNSDDPELQRIKLINKDAITYMRRKHNILNKRDFNEMGAASFLEEEYMEEEDIQEEYTQGEYIHIEYIQEEYTPEENAQEEYTPEVYTQEENVQEEYTPEEYTQEEYAQEEYTQQVSEELMEQNSREVKWAHFKSWAESLDDDNFDKFMGNIQGAIREADQARDGSIGTFANK